MEHKKCCFISQRAMEFSFGLDEDDSRCIATKAHIKEVIKSLLERGVTHFSTSMTLGFGTYVAEIIETVRLRYPEATLECIIPFEEISVKWSRVWRGRYFEALMHCDKEILLSTKPTPTALIDAYQFMLERSDHAVFITCDTDYDGTQIENDYIKSLMEFANSHHVKIIQIKADSFPADG